MIYHKVFVFAAVLCCASAAFPGHISKNDNKIPRSCNPQGCDQLCRRLGFPGGVCVGDRCKCDNFKLFIDEKIQRSCNPQGCDQLCPRLGFPGGVCVGDRCKCDDFKLFIAENEVPTDHHEQQLQDASPAAEAGQEPASSAESFGSCTNAACSRLCAYWGYPYYRCSGDYCICYRPRLALSEKTESEADKYEELVLDKKTQVQELARAAEAMASCTNAACSNLCAILGYPYYRCSGDYCICYRPALALDEHSENPDAGKSLGTHEFVLSQDRVQVARAAESYGACTNAACSRLCASLGYPYYRCSGDYCICYRPGFSLADNNKLPDSDKDLGPQELVLDQEAQARQLANAAEAMASCSNAACSNLCATLGYPYYRCSGDYCICYRPAQALNANNEAPDANKYQGPQEIVLDREAQAEIEVTPSIYGAQELHVRLAKEKPGQSMRSAQSYGTCNANSCYNSCRNMGYLRGGCLSRGCMCWGRR